MGECGDCEERMKVYCASQECKYNDRNRCTAVTISLSWHSVLTIFEGRQEFLKCKQFKMSERYKQIEEKFAEMEQNWNEGKFG